MGSTGPRKRYLDLGLKFGQRERFQTTITTFRSEVWIKRETLFKELGQFPLF